MRVVLCGDQSLYRAALRTLIESRTDLRIVAESTNHPAAVAESVTREADVVLMDYELGAASADPGAFEALLHRFAPLPIVILTSSLEPESCHTALRLGVSGVVLKGRSGENLLDALLAASRGQVWLERQVLMQMFADSSHIRRISCQEQEKIDQLTPRERQIVAVACTGVTNKQIAEKLSISEATVRHHLGSVFAKLGVSTRSELVVYGYRHNLVTYKEP